MTDPADLSATEALRRLRNGRLSAAVLAEAALDRIAAREKVLRAFAWQDPALLRRRAAAADRAGRPGALAGLAVGVKDVLDTADMPTQYGSPAWTGWRPRADAAAVAALRAAGGLVAGKTVTTEFATRHPGPTTNPWNPRHTPGGSSSGSAAGVAAGFFPLAIGTQTGGSVLRPAAFCGVVGFKPGFGLIHRGGMKVMSESLDTIGVFGRSVADCALLAGVLSGGLELGDPDAKPGRPPRLALALGPGATVAAPETLALMDRAAEACRRAGATVQPLETPPEWQRAHDLHGTVTHAEAAQSLGWELVHATAQLSEGLRDKLVEARGWPAGRLAEARAAFAAARAALPARLEGFDAVLTPAAPGEAPEGIGWTGDAACNSLWTALHLPCVAVPAGVGPGGLPLGVQVVGLPGGDAAALAWAEWVRAALA
jgi:Asp-tRNA(Asn)/Glu-tRNA(Gln) amidotransferase A subunit family amidase